MARKALCLGLVLLGLAARQALGFSDDLSSWSRSYDSLVARTNSAIQVTATFTNGGTNTMRGLFYGEQVPSFLLVTNWSVTLNGQSLTNYAVESGQPGDVYAGCTPWRWSLETPTNYSQANPLAPQGVVQISYSLLSPVPGSFSLQSYDWADTRPPGTNAAGFGYSEAAEQQGLNFLVTTNPPLLSAQYSSDGYVVALQGEPGASYVVEASPDLQTWAPVATNTFPFSFTNAEPDLACRFFRARIFPR